MLFQELRPQAGGTPTGGITSRWPSPKRPVQGLLAGFDPAPWSAIWRSSAISKSGPESTGRPRVSPGGRSANAAVAKMGPMGSAKWDHQEHQTFDIPADRCVQQRTSRQFRAISPTARSGRSRLGLRDRGRAGASPALSSVTWELRLPRPQSPDVLDFNGG